MAPVVNDVADRYPNVDLIVVDVDAPGAELGSVKGVPTMTAITADGTTTGRSTGAAGEAQIISMFEAATTGTRIRTTMDPTTRLIRIGAGVALGVDGIASAAPLVAILGAASFVWGTYDLLAPRGRRPAQDS